MNPSDDVAPDPVVKPATRRLFVALPLPAEVREQIADLSGRLQKGARFTALQASWVPPENIHLTLHFMGSVEEEKLSNLEASLGALKETLAPFELSFKGLGYFPYERAPKVLWIGVHRPPEHLKTMVGGVGAAIREAGVELQHDNFHPHLTLARFRSLKGTAAFTGIAKNYAGAEAGSMQVDSFCLMESLLGDGLPVYKVVSEFRLGPTKP